MKLVKPLALIRGGSSIKIRVVKDVKEETLKLLLSNLFIKRGYVGTYHKMSGKHLQKYCDEFSYKYNARRLSPIEKFRTALVNSTGRLMYQDLINKITKK